MSPTPTPGPEKPKSPTLDEVGALRALVDAMKTRVVSGLIMALPIALTFWILYQLYLAMNNAILKPASQVVVYLLTFRQGFDPDGVYARYISPAIAIFLVIGLLYILGLFARSGVRRAFDWVLFRLPVVTTIYKALSNVFESLDAQRQGSSFQRVVLVEFPHPGSKALGFVSKSLADASTGRTILCVCVLTGVVPPAGFTLYVPEEQVTDVDWSVNQALQAILSGGITTPGVIHYERGLKARSTGPIVDPTGHPFAPAEANSGPEN
jgi:uncharacterized membrane protein